jgi:prevent-host-death family protein
MSTVGAFEAKTHMAELLRRVAGGERITITMRGAPVAMLVPVGGAARRTREEAAAELKEFGRGRKLGGLSLKGLVEEGRRR